MILDSLFASVRRHATECLRPVPCGSFGSPMLLRSESAHGYPIHDETEKSKDDEFFESDSMNHEQAKPTNKDRAGEPDGCD